MDKSLGKTNDLLENKMYDQISLPLSILIQLACYM